MIGFLEKFKTFNVEKESKKKYNRILCIIEGETELKYIGKVFEIYGFQGTCSELSETYVKVAWGNKMPINVNIVDADCHFPGGGSIKGQPVPTPAISAFELFREGNTIPTFDSVIIIFDSDKDKKNYVENYLKKELTEFNTENLLLISNPCFESTLVDFCKCGTCRDVINSIKSNGKPPCEKYKKKFSGLPCFSSFSNSKYRNKRVKAEGLISCLIEDDLINLKSELNDLNSIIKKAINI